MSMVDTNILLYSVDESEPLKRERAIAVMDRLRRPNAGSLSTQILGEFFVNAQRKITPRLSARQAEAFVEVYLEQWTVYPVTPAIVLQAVRDVQRLQLSYWDALIIATARTNGVATVLSEDLTDGRTYGGVRIVSPFSTGFDLAALDAI